VESGPSIFRTSKFVGIETAGFGGSHPLDLEVSMPTQHRLTGNCLLRELKSGDILKGRKNRAFWAKNQVRRGAAFKCDSGESRGCMRQQAAWRCEKEIRSAVQATTNLANEGDEYPIGHRRLQGTISRDELKRSTGRRSLENTQIVESRAERRTVLAVEKEHHIKEKTKPCRVTPEKEFPMTI
jgi:hypothetical protein